MINESSFIISINTFKGTAITSLNTPAGGSGVTSEHSALEQEGSMVTLAIPAKNVIELLERQGLILRTYLPVLPLNSPPETNNREELLEQAYVRLQLELERDSPRFSLVIFPLIELIKTI
jgi:hypothetical protein